MDLEEAFSRLTKANSKTKYAVMSKDGKIIRASDPENLDTSVMDTILTKWKSGFRDLTFLKIRTKDCEYFVIPDQEFIIVAYLEHKTINL